MRSVRLLYNSVSSELIFRKYCSERALNICVTYCKKSLFLLPIAVVLEVWFSDQQHQHHLGTYANSWYPPPPRPTESESLGLGPSHLSQHALQVILMHIQAEDHCQEMY